jgi:single-strand selective monofunctional uracil DNA glycosylase
MSDIERLIAATKTLRGRLAGLRFRKPADLVYCPLEYAWEIHRAYLEKFADGPKRVVFLGMNPGPYGMGQTGVPFGEVAAVRDWMGLRGTVTKPAGEHPAKPVEGLDCQRSEVSGARLWGMFAQKFGSPENFFHEHYVHNYCPLLFLENTKLGRNVTPENLPAADMAPVYAACDDYLRELVAVQRLEWVVGVGGFASGRAQVALAGLPVRVALLPHPSPANPGANKDWAGAATRALIAQGVWGK